MYAQLRNTSKRSKGSFVTSDADINMGLWYSKDYGFELIAYSDADHAGCHNDCKSTYGGLQFLGDKLFSWSFKKIDFTTMSTAEAEHISLSACCAQEHVEQGTTELYFVGTEYQLADLFTKVLPKERFEYLVHMIVETTNNPFIAPASIVYIQPFMKIVGYQGEVDKVSAFFTKCLAQPWQTMFKVFNRCLTSRTSRHDQTKINILQIFHAVVNRNVIVRGMLIPDEFLTHDIRATVEYKEFEKRHKTHTPTTIAGDVVQKKQKRKQNIDETSSPKPSLKICVKQFQSSTTPIPTPTDDDDDYGNRIEPRSHKEHPKIVNDDENEKEKKDGGIHKNVDNILHDIIPKIASNATNDIIENNLPKLLAGTIMKERDTFQETVPDLISKEFADHVPKTYTFHDSDHDDHQEDDAPPEGEKRAKRRRTSKRSQSARGSDVGEVIPEDEYLEIVKEFQDVVEHVPTIYDHERMEATLKDMMSNQFKDAEEYAYHL
ncbi:hypothetical protein Tco_1005129 [Tanacetum coccineum]|uniref:Copia protein n=1 Tax=Tanacetum coccineum TaxID=301880 RepID=A0ABQ5FDU9_9ASTR